MNAPRPPPPGTPGRRMDMSATGESAPCMRAELVAQLVGAGAVGINIEDGGGDPALLAAKIAAARGAAAAQGVDLFINARTDVWLRGLAEPARRVSETLSRAARYRAAGASGLF